MRPGKHQRKYLQPEAKMARPPTLSANLCQPEENAIISPSARKSQRL